MKLVKATQLGITTSIDGNLYSITSEGVTVSDDVASRMKEQFLHTVEVTDISPEKPVEIVEPATESNE
jgi:hypothetical protein